MTGTCYITSAGIHLPGDPVGNDEMEDVLGRIAGKDSRARERVLKQNGIQSRHYAIDRSGRTTISNAGMAAEAVKSAVSAVRWGLKISTSWWPPPHKATSLCRDLPAWCTVNWTCHPARSRPCMGFVPVAWGPLFRHSAALIESGAGPGWRVSPANCPVAC
ncbi:MAG: hypothetical protein Ct9H300mP1_30190 [Planctomycetaceae bacterium]|nr:MAG: hypothetical protein Ct9H300mP1_30190 [Planctomycetaceae bacterium]